MWVKHVHMVAESLLYVIVIDPMNGFVVGIAPFGAGNANRSILPARVRRIGESITPPRIAVSPMIVRDAYCVRCRLRTFAWWHNRQDMGA